MAQKSKNSAPNSGVGIVIGILLGTAFGISTNNLVVGLAFGLMVGAALARLLQRPVDGTPLPIFMRWMDAARQSYNYLEKPMNVTAHTAPVGQVSYPSRTTWWGHMLWVVAAALLGWIITTVFAGMLQLPRAIFLLPYVGLSSLLLAGYIRWSGVDIAERFRHHWVQGLIGAALVGAFLIWSVRNQPASAHTQGLALVLDLLWLGVVYGLVDGLLLSVLPVLATWHSLSLLGWTKRWPGRIAVGVLALVASLFVTVAYHLGYPEFRNPQIISPMIGVGTMSLAYVLSGNPLAAVLSHIAMHIAAVLQGADSVIQLPPHY